MAEARVRRLGPQFSWPYIMTGSINNLNGLKSSTGSLICRSLHRCNNRYVALWPDSALTAAPADMRWLQCKSTPRYLNEVTTSTGVPLYVTVQGTGWERGDLNMTTLVFLTFTVRPHWSL